MKEQFDHSQSEDKDRISLPVDIPTVFALAEYVIDKEVPLAYAVHALLTIGMYIVTNQAAGFNIEEEYPNGELDYEAPQIDEAFFQYKNISVNLPSVTREGLELMSKDAELDQGTMLAQLIEKARNLRIKHKKGATFYLVAEDGHRMSTVLLFT
jgi:hypothetical protein